MKYTYSGPLTGAALPGGAELMLVPGRVVELDSADELTLTLLGLKRLAPVPEPEPAPAPEPVVVPEAPRRTKR
jgi:hypothetical protein